MSRCYSTAHATSATFSPDGTTVLIGSDAGEGGGLAQLFDVATARPVGRTLPHPRPVHAAAFRPDGKVFVTECGRWGNATEKVEARFWDPDGTSARGPLAHECMAPAVAVVSRGDEPTPRTPAGAGHAAASGRGALESIFSRGEASSDGHFARSVCHLLTPAGLFVAARRSVRGSRL